jgi:hypothetical protein
MLWRELLSTISNLERLIVSAFEDILSNPQDFRKSNYFNSLVMFTRNSDVAVRKLSESLKYWIEENSVDDEGSNEIVASFVSLVLKEAGKEC